MGSISPMNTGNAIPFAGKMTRTSRAWTGASMTTVPVIGVPVQSRALSGLDSLLSIVQMPGGVPVATMAIGSAGATNAGLFAIGLLATRDPALRARLQAWREARAQAVREETLE